jgi:hypothetical protein
MDQAGAESNPHFSRNCMFPGNANLRIGVLPRANPEIGVPRIAPTQFVRTVLSDFEAIPDGSPCYEAPFEHWGGAVPFLR